MIENLILKYFLMHTKIKKYFEKKYKENLSESRIETLKMLKRITPSAKLDTIVFLVTDHCNLNCQCCDCGSPIAEPNNMTIESFTNDIIQLKKLTEGTIGRIILSGGDPLLNPNILEMCEIAQNHFPNTTIRLQTNGILLENKAEKFWKELSKNRVKLVCTKYPIKVNFTVIEKKCKQYNIDFSYFDCQTIKTTYFIPFDPEGKQDEKENFLNCFHANDCINIRNGKICTCTPAANAHHFNKYFKENMEICDKNFINIYDAKNIEEILAFLAKPIPFCKYCNVKGRKYNIPWKVSEKKKTEWV